MRPRPSPGSLVWPLLWLATGCTIDVNLIWDAGHADTGHGDASTETSGTETSASGSPDLPEDPAATQSALCQVPDGQLDGYLPCEFEPLAAVIAPTIAWTWTGPGGEDSVVTTPLVANVRDTNGDGFIDLCDAPQIIVAAVELPEHKTDPWPAGHLHVIDGDPAFSGSHSFMIPTPIDASVNPALGDLDGDGVPELVALQASGPNSPYAVTARRLVAFKASGELLWEGAHWHASQGGGAIALADLDGDGSPEILAPEYVATAEGALAWAVPDPAQAYSMPVAVDLDLDLQLEVMYGASAYAADGTWLFDLPSIPRNQGSVAIANFDDDPYPELYVQYHGQQDGQPHSEHGVYEHDGTLKASCPTDAAPLTGLGGYPVAIHDIDGDDKAELLFGFNDNFYVLSVDGDSCSVRWTTKADTTIGLASGTVFDFLGTGRSEVIYADRSRVQLFSPAGELLFIADRTARESISNPIIVDVDGDGGAELVITSSKPLVAVGDDPPPATPTLIVIGSAQARFASTRRIWNQHTYHYSNTSEDGQIPLMETPHSQGETGFRVNHPAIAAESCIPATLRNGR